MPVAGPQVADGEHSGNDSAAVLRASPSAFLLLNPKRSRGTGFCTHSGQFWFSGEYGNLKIRRALLD